MEVLIFILIMVFVFANKNKKTAKTAGTAQAKPANRAETVDKAARARSQVREKAARVKAAAPQNVRPVKLATQSSPVFMAAPMGDSLLDEEGCVGGSLEHTHDEGESRAEHARHMEASQHREAEETRAAQSALELSQMNLRRLRQAVVMAEILDRPKALRRRA